MTICYSLIDGKLVRRTLPDKVEIEGRTHDIVLDSRIPTTEHDILFYFSIGELDFRSPPFLQGLSFWTGVENPGRTKRRVWISQTDPNRRTLAHEVWKIGKNEAIHVVDVHKCVKTITNTGQALEMSTPKPRDIAIHIYHKGKRFTQVKGLTWALRNLELLNSHFKLGMHKQISEIKRILAPKVKKVR